MDMNLEIDRIKKVLSEGKIEISTEQAEELWKFYSNCLHSTWFGLPEENNDSCVTCHLSR